jgi:septation ring formation regulator EzrA
MIAIVGIVCLTVMVIAFMYFNRQSEKERLIKAEKERKLDS